MRFLILLVIITVAVARPDDVYAKYDHMNIDDLVGNTRLLQGYANCFTDEGTCTADAKEMKSIIPEGIQSSCGKCSDTQKEQVAKFIIAIKMKLPEAYAKLNKLHDPEGKYQDDLQKFLDKYGH